MREAISGSPNKARLSRSRLPASHQAGRPPHSPVRRARLCRVLLYCLTLACSAAQFSLVPILPAYSHRFGLSGAGQGALLGAAGFAVLAVSLPAGALSDRFGARRLTLWSGGLLTAAMFTQAVAGSYQVLLASRLGFGVGYALIWTAGLSWLAEAAPGESSLGGSVASSGIGSVIGPALSGALVTYLGLAVPFLAAAAVFAVVTAALSLLSGPAAAPGHDAPARASFRAAARDRSTITAAAAVVTAGVTTGVSALLIPDELHAAGASPARIGLVFAIAGTLFVAGSTVTVAAGRRAVRNSVIFASMLTMALALFPAALTTSSLAIIMTLCAATGARSILWTVAYPLAAATAQGSRAGLGVVMGLLNGVWAATALLSPVMAGFAVDLVGARMVFTLTAATCLAVLAATALAGRRPRLSARARGHRNAGHRWL
jgi:predicted MFS family arabinose efflux permease